MYDDMIDTAARLCKMCTVPLMGILGARSWKGFGNTISLGLELLSVQNAVQLRVQFSHL